MWLRRLFDRLRERPAQSAAREQARRVEAVLGQRDAFTAEALADALLSALGEDRHLSGETVVTLSRALQAPRGDEPAEKPALETEALLVVWGRLADRFPGNPYAVACHGDALLAVGRPREALERFLEAFEMEPPLVDEFGDPLATLAEAEGGMAWLRFRLACLRAELDGADDDTADGIRENYAELLDEHAGDAEACRRIRQVGEEIRRLEAADRLPRAFIRRTAARRKVSEG